MRTATSGKKLSVEEYIAQELSSERRSEYINGQLFEMPGEKDINNQIALRLALILMQFLKNFDAPYQVYAHDVKVKIHGEDKYYYTDVFVTKEEKTEANQYTKSQPVFITEVVSESTQVNDYVDKYIDYTKIPSLEYYLIVEPETLLITVFQRAEDRSWTTVKYTRLEDSVRLDKLNVSFLLSEVYR